MFVGALPKETLQQVARLVRLDKVSEAYVCCSGSFRIEQTLTQLSDTVDILVYVDGKLAGGFIYSRLLSDFSIVRERKVSKLVAMLASSRDPVAIAERRMLIQPEQVFTTAFTKKAVSMKCRGIFGLAGRGDGFLNYASHIRDQSPADVYAEWWRRFAAASTSDTGRPRASA